MQTHLTSSPISQGEINNILWKACDTFRGTVDPSEYKNYILVMLFVKYISDLWRNHFDEFMLRYKGDCPLFYGAETGCNEFISQ